MEKKRDDVAMVVARVCPTPEHGLTSEQIRERFEAGLTNDPPPLLTRSVGRIIRDNCLTWFNMMNLILAAAVVLVGEYKNALFLGVAAFNTLIGILQELRAKRSIDRLSILTQAQVSVIREGRESRILQEYIVLDDVVRVSAGHQICADGVVLASDGIEVDESSLTGEADPVEKKTGQPLLSGTTVLSGEALMHVTAVGADNYVSKLSQDARREKRARSELTESVTRVLKFLSVVIPPLGLLLFGRSLLGGHGFNEAVLAACVAMVGMIPEGLVLLCGLASAVGAIRLSRRNTLVRSMSGIETLARVDVLCLDKTGTITDGTMHVEQMLAAEGVSESAARAALARHLYTMEDENPTGTALKRFCPERPEVLPACLYKVPFSSARKWSACQLEGEGAYVLGALEFLRGTLSPAQREAIDNALHGGLRVLTLARSEETLRDKRLPGALKVIAVLLLSDHIREEAQETFRYFTEQGVTLKVISGDNPVSVSALAVRAGLPQAEQAVDMSALDGNADLIALTRQYTVFGRVTPEQKKALVEAMQQSGHTVAMTGDGVNDLLALKQADCSVAMASGSDAAKSISDFVLVDSNFSSMVRVVGEGRRVVNNIEKVAALYLVKTVYSMILTLAFLGLPFLYPFELIQLTPVSALTVGLPSFFLAMQPNYGRIQGRFLYNALKHALPAALTISLLLIAIQVGAHLLSIAFEESSTLCVMVIALTGLLLLYHVCRPLDLYRGILLGVILALSALVYFQFGAYFELSAFPRMHVLFGVAAGALVLPAYPLTRKGLFALYRWIERRREKKMGTSS